MTSTKCEPSPCSPWKCLNSEIVSIVPPDLVETMNSVFSTSISRSTASICSGSVESRTCRRSPPSCVPVGEAEDLGREARAAHAEQHRVGQPVGLALGDERVERVGLLEHLVGDRQPAEAVGHLGRALGRPQRAVALPDAARDVLVVRALDALGERLLELRRQVGLDRRRAARDDRLALALDAVEQLGHRDHERVDAVAQQLVGDVVEVDARPRAARRGRRSGPRRRSRRSPRPAGGRPSASAAASCSPCPVRPVRRRRASPGTAGS